MEAGERGIEGVRVQFGAESMKAAQGSADFGGLRAVFHPAQGSARVDEFHEPPDAVVCVADEGPAVRGDDQIRQPDAELRVRRGLCLQIRQVGHDAFGRGKDLVLMRCST
jgi:hypothetical protein